MVFKIDWEKTHKRHVIPDDIIKSMLEDYYPSRDIESYKLLDGGCANSNVIVYLCSQALPVILRVYIRDPGSAEKEKKISGLLCGNVPVPEFYYDASLSGYKFAIVKFLPGRSLQDFLLNNGGEDIEPVMFKVGHVLGQITNIKFPHSGFFNDNLEIKEELNQQALINYCMELLKNWNVQSALSQDKINQIKKNFDAYASFLPDGNEKNLVHADFDPANILVDKRNGEWQVSGVLDWEFAFSGSTLHDVSNMLRYAHLMPQNYTTSFLNGLTSQGYQPADSWNITMYLLNIISLLDCLSRTAYNTRPNQNSDIQKLIAYFLFQLDGQ